MKRLSALDSLFLYFETPETPMHVASVTVFQPESAADGLFERFRAHTAARLDLLPSYRRRLKTTPLGLDHPVWTTDENPDLDYHVRRSALPKPGGMAELRALVGELHAIPLDRSRPLWEYHFIEGLEEGRFAVYVKVHHCTMDGLAGMATLGVTYDLEANADKERPPARVAPPDAEPSDAIELASTALGDFVRQGEYEALLSLGSPYFPFPDFDENACATMFHTTGTTGRPKGVYFSHRQLVLHTLTGLVEYGLTPSQGRFHRDDVYMPMTPMFHVHAWGCPYTATLSGCKIVFPGRYAPEMFLKLIETEKVTFTHCVPTILQMLLSAPGGEKVDLSHLSMVIGGSALPPALARAAIARGIDVYSGYGLSESCPMLAVAHVKSEHLSGDPAAELPYRTSTGIAAPMVDLRVVDENMTDVAHDGHAVGEIVVRAPWLATGYLNNAEASEVLWGGGYMHTGDVASIDADGYLRISDRLKDVVKSGGEWISSIALENIIMEKPGVRRVAVIAVKNVKWGERPLAIIMLDQEAIGQINEDDIRLHVASYVERGVISKIAIPEAIAFADELPLTSVGKVDKKKLRSAYRAA